MSPGRFGWLFEVTTKIYMDDTIIIIRASRCLSIVNIHGARRAGRRRRKACRLWTGGGPQRAYSGKDRGILCRHAHSLFRLQRSSPHTQTGTVGRRMDVARSNRSRIFFCNHCLSCNKSILYLSVCCLPLRLCRSTFISTNFIKLPVSKKKTTTGHPHAHNFAKC